MTIPSAHYAFPRPPCRVEGIVGLVGVLVAAVAAVGLRVDEEHRAVVEQVL